MKLKKIQHVKKRSEFNKESILYNLENNRYKENEIKCMFFIFCTYDFIQPIRYIIENNLIKDKYKIPALREALLWGKNRTSLYLLKKNTYLYENDFDIINIALQKSSNEVAKFVIENFNYDFSSKNNHFFNQACRYGRQGVVEMLLELKNIDPTNNNYKGFNDAASFNKLGTLRLLLKNDKIDPLNNNYQAFKNAAKSLNYSVLNTLVKCNKVDLSFNNNELLIYFSNSLRVYDNEKNMIKRKRIFDLLTKDKKVIKSLTPETLKYIKQEDYKNIISTIMIQNKIKDF